MTLMRQRDLTVPDDAQALAIPVIVEPIAQQEFSQPLLEPRPDPLPEPAARPVSPVLQYLVGLALGVLGLVLYLLTDERTRD